MSRFLMGFQIILTMVFFIGIGVEANPTDRCMSMFIFEEEIDNIVKLGGEEKFQLFCSNMTAFFRCKDEVLEEQTGFKLKSLAPLLKGTDIGNALGIFVNIIDLVDDVCTDGSELHEAYMANADCFQNLDDDLRKKCEEQSKNAYESFTDVRINETISKEQKIDQSCMTTAYQLGCGGAAIHEKCGDEGFDFFKKIVSKIGFLKSGVCSANIVDTIKNGFADSLDISESRRSLYRVIFELRKRRK